jgi:hypothetical protein
MIESVQVAWVEDAARPRQISLRTMLAWMRRATKRMWVWLNPGGMVDTFCGIADTLIRALLKVE